MTDIKRYKIEDGLLDFGIKGGLFVRDEDHAAIVAALQERLSRYSMSAGQVDQRKSESDAVRVALGFSADADDVAPCDLVDAIAALQEQVRALAAEGSAIKQAFKQAANTVEEYEIYGDLKYAVEPSEYEALADAIEETPNTDATLREIRAQAVEEFCDLINGYGKVEPDYFNPDFADLYAKIYKGIYESILDNPAVHDMESLVDWLEAGASNSRSYADMAIKYAARIRAGEKS